MYLLPLKKKKKSIYSHETLLHCQIAPQGLEGKNQPELPTIKILKQN